MDQTALMALRAGGIATALLVISVLLTLPAADRRANRFLALLLGVLTLNLAHSFYTHSNALDQFHHLFMLSFPLYLLLGPLLFFYTQAMTEENHHHKRGDLFHVLPVIGMWILLSPLFFQSADFKRDMLSFGLTAGRSQWGLIFIAYLPIVISITAYAVASLRLLHRHRERIREHFSSLEQIDLRWLEQLAWFMILTSLAVFLPAPEGAPRLFWFKLISVALIFFIGHMGLRQPAIFHRDRRRGSSITPEPVASITDEETPSDSRPEKYRSTGLSSELAEKHWQRLQQLMVSESPYLDPDLTLGDLAERINLHSAHVSQVINSCAGKNFYDYINEHRIEAAKTMLLDNSQRRSVLDVALDAGFNSKSTFYSQFKKHCGVTPTAWRKSLAATQ